MELNTYHLSDDVSLGMGNTNPTLNLGQNILGSPQVLSQMLVLFGLLFEFTDEDIMVQTLNEFMKKSFNPTLTQFEHLLETIPL